MFELLKRDRYDHLVSSIVKLCILPVKASCLVQLSVVLWCFLYLKIHGLLAIVCVKASKKMKGTHWINVGNVHFNIILNLVAQTRLSVGLQVNSWCALLTHKAVFSDVDTASVFLNYFNIFVRLILTFSFKNWYTKKGWCFHWYGSVAQFI